MKKIFNYISTLIYFYLLILFSVIAHSFANDDYVFFSIIIIIISIFVTCLSFMLNKSKKIDVRRYYLFVMTLTSLFTILNCFKCLFYNSLENNVFYKWLTYFVFAGMISFYLFELFFTFKPLFKKNYELEKFDYQNFMMLINALAFGLVSFFLFYKIDMHYIDVHNDFSKYTLSFNEIKWPIVFITIGYTSIYSIISILYYKNIECKNK